MATPWLLAAGAVTVPYVLWWLFGNFIVRSPLENLPGPTPTSLLLGNFKEIQTRQMWKYWAHLAETYGPVSVMVGLLGRRVLLVHDPKALHTILVKEQEFFPTNVSPSNPFTVLLGPGLLSTDGAQHKKQRKMLTPVFSVAHLRNMCHIFYSVAHKVRTALNSRIPADGTSEVLDFNDWMGRTTLEMIGQAGLGYSFDNFEGDSADDYGESLKLFFPALSRLEFIVILMDRLTYILPDSLLRRLLSMVPQPGARQVVKICDTIRRRSQEIVSEKKSALQKGDEALMEEVGEGKDLMSVCLRANMTASEAERLSDEELHAQMSTFIIAGMDTTSNALCRIFQLLAQNPTVQEKLREELVEARGGCGNEETDTSYDDLIKLPYLDAVCRETLRIFSPATVSARIAAKDLVIPLSNPVRCRDGKDVNEVMVPEGTIAFLNYQGSNSDRQLWGEHANEWKPERWLAPLPSALEDARVPGVYANLMTFGAGSRSCIGLKFSQLEMKVVLAVLLPKFSFELTDQPITWNSSAIVYPTMGEESTKPEMLLKVKALL